MPLSAPYEAEEQRSFKICKSRPKLCGDLVLSTLISFGWMTYLREEKDGLERPHYKSGPSLTDLPIAVVFLCLLYMQLWHHVLWRDELNALGIVWASPTASSLFWHIHHEGHPWLWYVILWIPSRFTRSVLVLKVVQGLVSTAVILFVALRSPFRRWEKVLVLSGYFFVFEYTVLSRMYGVLLLLFVLYLARRTRHPDAPIMSAVLLGLMASADTIGIILSGALLVEYVYTLHLHGKPLFPRRIGVLALLVYGAMTVLAVWSAMPSADISWRTTGKPFKDAKDLSHLYGAFLNYMILPFVPVKSPRSHFFWNPTLHLNVYVYTIPMLIVIWLLFSAFRGECSVLLMLAMTVLAGTMLGHFIYPGSERHFGIVFLAFLAGAWVQRARAPSKLLPRPVYVLLAVSSLASVLALIGSWYRPFSYDKAAADWLRRTGLDRMPLVGDEDTSAVDVAQYLHRSVYMIECSCEDTYLLYSTRRDNYKKTDEAQRVLEAAHHYHDEPILFMMVHEMHPNEREQLLAEGFTIEPLASFSQAEEVSENFYFYRLELARKAAGVQDEPASERIHG